MWRKAWSVINQACYKLSNFTELTFVQTQLCKLTGRVSIPRNRSIYVIVTSSSLPQQGCCWLLSDKVTQPVFECVSRGEPGGVISETCRQEKRKKHGTRVVSGKSSKYCQELPLCIIWVQFLHWDPVLCMMRPRWAEGTHSMILLFSSLAWHFGQGVTQSCFHISRRTTGVRWKQW